MRSYFRCLVIILLNVAVHRVEAKDLKVAFGLGRPPYVYWENGKWKGIEVEVVGEVLRRMGYQLKADNMSALRLEAEARHGNSYDVVVGVAQGPEGSAFYSESYISFENYVVALKKKNLRFKEVKDLSSLKVGTWLNAWRDLGPVFKTTFGPKANGSFLSNYKEYAKQEDQCAAFWQEKVDIIVIDKNVFGWFRMTLASKMDTSKDIEVFRLFPTEMPSYVAFRKKELREIFNAELTKLKDSGEYNRIVRSYAGENLAGFKLFKESVR